MVLLCRPVQLVTVFDGEAHYLDIELSLDIDNTSQKTNSSVEAKMVLAITTGERAAGLSVVIDWHDLRIKLIGTVSG